MKRLSSLAFFFACATCVSAQDTYRQSDSIAGLLSITASSSDCSTLLLFYQDSGTLLSGFVAWNEPLGVMTLVPAGSSYQNESALACSDDGSVIVGSVFDAGIENAFVWKSQTGFLNLTPGGVSGRSVDVSEDGQVVVGNYGSGIFRWTVAGGFQQIGSFLGGQTEVFRCNADGTMLAGIWVSSAGVRRYFRWTQTVGFTDLGASASSSARVTFMSDQGDVVFAYDPQAQGGAQVLRWTQIGGMQPLPSLPGLPSDSLFVTDVSDDGMVAVGQQASAGGPNAPVRALRWTVGGGTQELLNPFAPGTMVCRATACSSDGSAVFGYLWDSAFQSRAFRWTAASGLKLMNTLNRPQVVIGAASDDGNTVAGFSRSLTLDQGTLFYLDIAPTGLGSRYQTPAIFNSTGLPARIELDGSDQISANNLTLTAGQLPTNQFGYFLRGTHDDRVKPIVNSQGALLLGGAIRRYNRASELGFSGSAGQISLTLDLSGNPSIAGALPPIVGSTWFFQAWFRDQNPGPTSNFSDGVCVTLY